MSCRQPLHHSNYTSSCHEHGEHDADKEEHDHAAHQARELKEREAQEAREEQDQHLPISLLHLKGDKDKEKVSLPANPSFPRKLNILRCDVKTRPLMLVSWLNQFKSNFSIVPTKFRAVYSQVQC